MWFYQIYNDDLGYYGKAHDLYFTKAQTLEAVKEYIDSNYAKGGEVDKKVLRERWAKKKDALENLANNISRLRTNLSKDLKEGDEKKKLTALVIKIMDETGERVGNDESANNGHFGVTGLKKKHIKVNGSNVKFKYVGKSGVEHEKELNDSTIASALKDAISHSPSEYVFETSQGFRIKNDRVNRYLNNFNVSAKDLRGYSANKWIITKLRSVKDREILNNDAKRKKKFNEIVKSVAEKVGHGSATLKKHYLLPSLEREFINHGRIVDLSNIKRTYEDGGMVMDESVFESYMKFSFDEARELARDNGLYLRKDFAISEGGKFYEPNIMYLHEDKKLDKVAITYLDDNENQIGELIFDLDDREIQIYFPILDIYDFKSYKRGGQTDEVNTGIDVINNLDSDPLDEDSDIPNDGEGIFAKGGKTEIKVANKELLKKVDYNNILPTYTVDDIRGDAFDLDRDDVNEILDEIKAPFNVTNELGSGANGTAWETTRGSVLKITLEGDEAYTSYIIFKNQQNFTTQAEIYNLFIVIDLDDAGKYFFIEKQKLEPFTNVGSDELQGSYNAIVRIAENRFITDEEKEEDFEELIEEQREYLTDGDVEDARSIFELAKKIQKESKAYGVRLTDNHKGNVGYDTNGKLLCYECAYRGDKSFLIGGQIKK